MSNLRKLSEATAEKDTELASLVDASAATFGALGEREAELTEATERLPGTLAAARDRARATAATWWPRPARRSRRCGRRRAGSARRSWPRSRCCARPARSCATTCARWCARRSRCSGSSGPSLRDLNRATPRLVRVGKILNYLANELGYNPPGAEEGYLFWLPWFAHNAQSTVSIDDAHGPVVRGLALFTLLERRHRRRPACRSRRSSARSGVCP